VAIKSPKFKPPSKTTGANGDKIEIYGWNKTCKYCGKADLRWVGVTNADTGTKKWSLEERDSTTPSGVRVHRCPAYTARDKAREEGLDPATVVTPSAPTQENYGEW
jgi:hypothetical protein